jgi:Ser/Thr protein kinase RdoA (MazF antagonist)
MTTPEALAALQRETGRAFVEISAPPGGQVSHATVVAREDGHRVVLKWWRPAGGESDSLAWLQRAARRVEVLRARGYPAPAYEVVAERDGILLVVQELLPGRPPEQLRSAHVRALVTINELQEDTQPGDPEWGAYLVRTLLHGAEGYCLHEPMRSHSAASAALLERILAIGEATPASSLPGHDLVHLDFHHLNVLAEGDAITGVIDCEGIRPGDRVFDLVTLLFCSVEGRLDSHGQDELWAQTLRLREPGVVRAYLAHMALRLASWSIVHDDDAVAARWIAHGRTWLDRAS